jgi:SpoVK/Ycf46/Vps4 family AAA+-type ATPase
LAKKIQPKYTWKDIVLPEDSLAQLGEICQWVKHHHQVLGEWGFDRKLSLGKGVNALFSGPSGTGKTMAAEIMANKLALDLYKINLSTVISKYIGETEKNLERIFTAAENANAILFFDEADALFGKRSEVRDSHDRYANVEISYLLQKMETYEGITILATNLRQNLDEAFVRRLAFTIHFPAPDEASRRQIWTKIWPAETPLAKEIDFDFLAQQFKLSGGNIKNIALAAAFLAAEKKGPVTMAHVLQAARREYQKLGKPLSATELGLFAWEASA